MGALEDDDRKWRALLNTKPAMIIRKSDPLNDYRDVRIRDIPGATPEQEKAARQQFEVDALVAGIL